MFSKNENDVTKEIALDTTADNVDENDSIHKDQQSMFDEEEAFSESMVVEKQEMTFENHTSDKVEE